MKTHFVKSLLGTALVIITMIKSTLAVWDMFDLGTLCAPTCSAPGKLLEDGKTWFWDPNEYIIDPERMACTKKLRLGFFPSLKNDAADTNLHHVAAEACDDTCRTCKISEDFSSGVADHCTSCDLNAKFILNIAGGKPTCVGELPDKSAMVIIKDNKIIGVSNSTSEYGGSTPHGELIDELSMPSEEDMGNSMNNPGFGLGGCPATNPDCTTPPAGNTTSPTGNNTSPPTDDDSHKEIFSELFPSLDNLPTTPAEIIMLNMMRFDFMDRRNLPNVVEMLEKAGVKGIGFSKGREDSCVGSIGENRKSRHSEPETIYVSIPCPADCDECKVGEYGHLECIVPATGKFTAQGKVVDACPVTGWVEIDTECVPCPAGTNGRCNECEVRIDASYNVALACINCPIGSFEADLDIMNITFKSCSPPMPCQNSEYYDGSACTSCGSDCAVCMGNTCGWCMPEFAMKIDESTGARECVPRDTGCGDNTFVNERNKCTK